MLLSQSVTYALQSLIQLAEADSGVFITRVKLAAIGKMPERFLLEVLHDLVKSGILRSNRGSGGGFALARPADKISLLDVVEAVDGPLQAGLPIGNCVPLPVRTWLQNNLEGIADAIRMQLSAMTLAHLVTAAARSPRECEP
jgi:Rrf2 family protein